MNYIKINGLKRHGENVTVIKSTDRKRLTKKLTNDIRKEILDLMQYLELTNKMYSDIGYLDISINIVELIRDNKECKIFNDKNGYTKVSKEMIIQLIEI